MEVAPFRMSLQHLLLGMIGEEPMTGYDLDKVFQRSIVHFWTTDRSQIYRTLHKLHEAEWVRIEHVVQEDLPDRKVYHLTQAGEAELDRWISTPITLADDPAREGWLGQIYFGARVEREQIVSVLQAYHDELRNTVKALTALHAGIMARIGDRKMPDWGHMRLMTIDYGITIQESAAEWIAQKIAEINQWDDDPPDKPE